MPHTPAFEPSQPPDERHYNSDTEETAELDTNDVYMEVNAELADNMIEEAMDEISKLGDPVKEETQVISIVNGPVKQLLSGHRPMKWRN